MSGFQQLHAGAELDAAIAERVMGWRFERFRYPIQGTPECEDRWYCGDKFIESVVSFCPSTDIADAWRVVEQMRERYGYGFQIDASGVAPNVWRCLIGWGDDPISAIGEAPTAPEAICRAALGAIEELATIKG